MESDLREEIRQHLDEKVAQLIAEGLQTEEAVARAQREFGNVALLQERSRDVWRSARVADFWKDVRYACRFLGRSKGFAAAAILTLALGIGANTAVFSIVNAVLLRPLPFPESDRLVSVQSRDVRGTPHPSLISYPTFFDFRSGNDVFEHIVSNRDTTFGLTGRGPASHLVGQIVSWDLFAMLRVQPALGRLFVLDDEKPGTRVVVISDEIWRRRFAQDPAVVGTSVLLDRQPYTIVGVAPAGFNFPIGPRQVQVWTTLAVDTSRSDGSPTTQQRGARMLDVMARLKPGVSIDVAHAHLDALGIAIADKHPDQNKIATTYVRPVRDRLVESARYPLLILLGAVGLVVVIACANIANLLLVRLVDRGREFAMRFALGASRGRLLRQVFTEHLVLAVLGSLAGVWLPIVAVRAVRPVWGEIIPRLNELTVDWRVAAFCISLSIGTAVLVGLPSVFQLARANLGGFLKDGAWGSTQGRERMHGALVVMQIACGLVLLSAAGLLVAEFAHLMRRDLGFQPHQVLTFSVDLPEVDYPGDKQVLFVTRLLQRLRTLPGVTAAAAGSPLPITGHQMSIGFQIQERPSPPSERPSADMAIVTPGYFEAIGAPLEQGRDFNEHDDASAPPVLVVNRAFADRFFPGEDVIGKQIEPGATMRGGKGTRLHEIVGVVRSARQAPLGLDDDPIYYCAYRQLTWFAPAILVRSTVPAETLVAAVRAAVAEQDGQVPVDEVRTLDELLSEGVAQPRFVMMFVAAFATMALLLTAIGLYGVLAYAVTSRAREIGVRMALGASRRSITLAVLKRATILVAWGLAIGSAGAIAGNRVLNSLLHGLSFNTIQLLIGASALVVVTAGVAALLPAVRAASVDPLKSLRAE